MINYFDNISAYTSAYIFNLKQNYSEYYNNSIESLHKFYKNDLTNTLEVFNYYITPLSTKSYLSLYLDLYYKNIVVYNNVFLNYTVLNSQPKFFYLNLIPLINNVLKFSLIIITLYTVFFLTNLYNYVNLISQTNYLAKFFILNESEKEVGPIDDMLTFVSLFILTLFSFIFSSFFYFVISGKLFIWAFSSLLLIMILILSIPLNLFLDYGFYFFSYVRGSASGNNYVKELLFDLISSLTIFIRFIIQNIRFLFIFSAIFELLEWIFTINGNVFFLFNTENKNLFFNISNISYITSNSNNNLLIINVLLFIIFFFYYTLHLLFLLLVQVVIYIGISSWLFFFLYSTKFLNKHEKFFLYNKYL